MVAVSPPLIGVMTVILGGLLTVMLTVAGVLCAEPSSVTKSKLSDPKYPAFGVYVRFGSVPVNVPFKGCTVTKNVMGSPSPSEHVSVMASGVSTSVTTLWASATGTSLTGLTVIDTVACVEDTRPSLTVNVNEDEPLKSRAGVYVRFG